jgi:hypothetical protein
MAGTAVALPEQQQISLTWYVPVATDVAAI